MTLIARSDELAALEIKSPSPSPVSDVKNRVPPSADRNPSGARNSPRV